jgi:hypothetical protein
MNRKFLRLVLAFFGLVALLAGAVAAWQIGFSQHGGFEFRTHRARYEAIVTAVTPMVVTDDSLYRFQLPDLTQPQGIQPVSAAQLLTAARLNGHTVAAMRQGKSLHLWIETVDRGHAGQYGYAYSSDSTLPEWDGDRYEEWWQLGDKLEDHWYAIYFDLG